jgi:hypothetical protein
MPERAFLWNDGAQFTFGLTVLFAHRQSPSQTTGEELPMTPRSETDAERFRKEAQECRELADKAENALDKEAWLLLAEDWLKLAREAEGGTVYRR